MDNAISASMVLIDSIFSALLNFKRQDQDSLIHAFNYFEGLNAFKFGKINANIVLTDGFNLKVLR